MSIMGKLKNKIIHRREDAEIDDLDEYRSTVLGQKFQPEPLEQPASLNQSAFQEPQRFQEPLRRENLSIEPFNASQYPQRDQLSFEPQRAEGNYEVMDRLRFIENQLAAIRSHTELINERLKNIEMKLGRSY